MKKLLTIFFVFTLFFATAQNKIDENIDVTHYEIHLNNIDFTNHTLQAQTIVTLTALNVSCMIVTLILINVRYMYGHELCQPDLQGAFGSQPASDHSASDARGTVRM